jgi:hypothetical protein
MEAENTRAMNNPLATSMGYQGQDREDEFPSTKFNDHNVQNYNDFETGVRATAATIENGLYEGVRSVLRDEAATVQALSNAVAPSRWGTQAFGNRSGDTATSPLGDHHGTGVDGEDPYAEINGETEGGGTADSPDVDRPADLDALIKATFGDKIPEDVSWDDLPAKLQEEVQVQLGYITTYIQHPELGSILIRSALAGGSEAKQQDHVRQTEWWQTTSDSMKVWTDLNDLNPGEAEAQRETEKATVSSLLSQMGITLEEEAIAEIVEDSLRFGWSDAQLIDAVAGQAVFNPDAPFEPGDLETVSQNVQEIASRYGLQFGDEQAFEFAQQVASGEKAEEDIRAFFVEQAKTRFPWHADQFEQGYSLTQIMDTRAGEISRLLGIDAQEVDFLNDPRFQSVLEFNPGGGEPTRSMTLQEARMHVGQLPEYQYTSDAMQRGSSFARTLLRKFGAI